MLNWRLARRAAGQPLLLSFFATPHTPVAHRAPLFPRAAARIARSLPARAAHTIS
jgi:hypothetical protein